nr:zinc finger, CCHC-type [Tanacetum cinerariifolium]
MLKLHEQSLPKKDATLAVMVIKEGRIHKANKKKKPQIAAQGKNLGKGMSKLAYAPKPKIPPLQNKVNHVKDMICHQCGKVVIGEGINPGLNGSKKLKPRALNMYMGNGHCAAIEAIGSFNLSIPN